MDAKEESAMVTFETSRRFAAPPEAVFAAFQAPQRLATWWGPDGFSNTFVTFEFEAGGAWRFTMHGPTGTNYPNECRFVAIEADRRIVVEHVSAPHFILAIGLEGDATGTTVTWAQTFDTPEMAASIEHIVVPANEQNLDRWQAEVARAADGSRPGLL